MLGERTAAVILAAGAGRRMRSARPKVLHEILERPLVHFPVLLAREVCCARTVVVVGHARESVEASVRAADPNAVFALQTVQRGTADAVASAREATDGLDHVLILSGDVPGLPADTVRWMGAARADAGTPLVALAFEPPDPTGYGRMVCDVRGRLLRIVEHRDASAEERAIGLVNAGIYLVDRSFLFTALTEVRADNAQNELYLTDIAAMAARDGTPGVVLTVPAHQVEGINDRAQLAACERRIRLERNNEFMRAGVTMLDPGSTRVGFGVTLEADVTLHAGVTLSGETHVERGAAIREGAILEDVRVGTNALIKPYCVLSQSVVGARAAVGPFAHLRPGSVLCEDSKVGNFVETKKARIGPGSKASHLSYLGDCELGEDVNIGAGTITCNYDGLDKHRTVFGDRVFVGSNTEIVAPVNIGAEALIGAGTTVIKDVPAGALALTRAPQVNIEGWALRAGPHARRQRRAAQKKED